MCFFCRGCLPSTSLPTQYWLVIWDSQPLEWNRLALASPLPHVWLDLFLEQNFFSYDFFCRGCLPVWSVVMTFAEAGSLKSVRADVYMYWIMISLHTWVDKLISKQLRLLAFDDGWSLGWGFGCSDWCRGFSVLIVTSNLEAGWGCSAQIPSTWFESYKFLRLESPQRDSSLGPNPLNVIQVLARIPSTWFESYKFVVMAFCVLVCNTGSSGSHLSFKEYSLVGCHKNSLDGPSWRALDFCSQGRPA